MSYGDEWNIFTVFFFRLMLEYVREEISRRYSLFLNDQSEFMSKLYNGLEYFADITHQCLDTNDQCLETKTK